MNHFFDDKKARDTFKRLLAGINGADGKSLFRVKLKAAWEDKQFSEDDSLSTYRLNAEEVQTIYHTWFSK